MRNVGVGLVLIGVCSVGACKLPLKKDKKAEETAAAPAAPGTPQVAAPLAQTPVASASAPAATTAQGYSTEGLRAIPDDCAAPLVILTAVPKRVFESESFRWRFATQVAAANHFSYPPIELPGPGHVRFNVLEHTPTKGAALIITCNDTKTCTQFAAAYRTAVPTSKPEVICGKATTLGAELGGPPIMALDAGEIVKASLPSKDDVVGQCVRLAACQAERDKKLDGDPAVACQKKPSQFKLACAAEFPCSAVLSCVER